MSRVIQNKGLASLCTKEKLNIDTLAAMCDCSRVLVHAYATGRRDLPYIEAKLAHVFSLTVPQLRARLRLPKLSKPVLERRKQKYAQRAADHFAALDQRIRDIVEYCERNYTFSRPPEMEAWDREHNLITIWRNY